MAGHHATSLVTKLTTENSLDSEDIRAILALPFRHKRFGAREPIVKEGDTSGECCLLVEGFAFGSKSTPIGERQIVSVHIPGEIPDLQSLHLKVLDHDLTTLSPCTLGFISHATLRQLNKARPNVAAALWRETLIDAAIFREWLLNVGRRPGAERMAHLIAEFHARLNAIGRAKGGSFELPITQIELGDCLGISTVHVNRVLRELRGEKLLRTDRSSFHVLDHSRLEQRGQFDPLYLRLH